MNYVFTHSGAKKANRTLLFVWLCCRPYITFDLAALLRVVSLLLTSGGRYGVLLLGLKLRVNRAFAFLVFAQVFFDATPRPFAGLWFDAAPWDPEQCPFPDPNNSETRASIWLVWELNLLACLCTAPVSKYTPQVRHMWPDILAKKSCFLVT